MNSNTEIKPSAAEPAETSEQQKSRMSPVMTEAYTQMLAAADEVEKVVVEVTWKKALRWRRSRI